MKRTSILAAMIALVALATQGHVQQPGWLEAKFGDYRLVETRSGSCFEQALYWRVGEDPRFANFIFPAVNEGWKTSSYPRLPTTARERTYTAQNQLVYESYQSGLSDLETHRELQFNGDWVRFRDFIISDGEILVETNCLYQKVASIEEAISLWERPYHFRHEQMITDQRQSD